MRREHRVNGLFAKLQTQKSSIEALAHRHRACNVRVFGSVVRGEESEHSDIDLLVDFLPGATLLDQVDLIEALSSALGRRVDVVSARALNKFVRERILQEAVAL